MKRMSPRRSVRCLAAWGPLLFEKNQRQAGICRCPEELRGQRDHARDQVRLDQRLADLALAGLLGGHRAVGEDHAGRAVGAEFVDDVLEPGEVRVACWGDAVAPPRVIRLARPVGHVERWVGQDEVGLQVGMLVRVERVFPAAGQVAVDAVDSQVHLGQAPGPLVGLLAVDGDVVAAAAVGEDELLRLDEHAARPAAGVIDPARVRLKDFDQDPDDAGRGVELAAALALGAGEHLEEILVDLAEYVAGLLARRGR